MHLAPRGPGTRSWCSPTAETGHGRQAIAFVDAFDPAPAALVSVLSNSASSTLADTPKFQPCTGCALNSTSRPRV
jgi:hypothetical protein